MKPLALTQNSPEWHEHRAKSHNASDAPAVMGVSPYVSRADLIRQRATGVAPEHDDATLARFARGHEVEPALRARAEKMIGDDLYPATATSDDGYLSASLDGVTMDETTIFEGKQYNAAKVACIERGEIPPADHWQIVQQFAVCDAATRCIYLVGDGSEDTACLEIPREWIEADIPKLRAAWAQFDADVAEYVPETPKAEVVGRAPETLPALRMDVQGMVRATNLAEWQAGALAIIRSINRDLQTDTDFANAEKAVKWCADRESELKDRKAAALAQMESVDALFRTVDEVSEELRATRLELDRLVKAEKDSRKVEIVRAGTEAVRQHVAAINATMPGFEIGVPASLTADLGAAIKGLRTIASIKDKVGGAVAHAKIAASQEADRRRLCIAVIEQHAEHRQLLPDAVTLVASKSPDDLRNLIAARIAEHKAKEDARLEAERERIRKEEEARAQREAAAKAEQERQRIRDEEQAKARQEAEDRRRLEARAALDSAEYTMERIPAGVATPTLAQVLDAAAPTHIASALKPEQSTAKVKLGDINARIAPLSISAEGLAQLGFHPVSTERAAKLYSASDLPRIFAKLAGVIVKADDAARTDLLAAA